MATLYQSKISDAADRRRGTLGSFGDLGPGELGGPDGIKLEQQILITETGAELLSGYPLETAFLEA